MVLPSPTPCSASLRPTGPPNPEPVDCPFVAAVCSLACAAERSSPACAPERSRASSPGGGGAATLSHPRVLPRAQGVQRLRGGTALFAHLISLQLQYLCTSQCVSCSELPQIGKQWY